MKRTMMKRQHDRSNSSPNKAAKRARERSSVSRFDDSPRRTRSVAASPDRRRGIDTANKFGSRSAQSQAAAHYASMQNSNAAASLIASGKRRNDSADRNSHQASAADEFAFRGGRSFDRTADYRILRVSGLNQRVNDAMMRDTLLREFKRYGDVDVKMSHSHDGVERVAHVYFRSAEDARDARHAKARLVLFDRTLQVEPVYPESGPTDRERRGRRSATPDSLSYLGGGGRARGRGPSPAHSNCSTSSLHRRGRRSDSADRALTGHLHHHHHHHHHPLSSSRDAIFRREHSASLAVSNSGGGHRGGGGGGTDYISSSSSASTAAQLARRQHHDDKKEKFPNYLHHIPPEEDDKANRTLFVGNLDVNITEAELRRIFEKYGVVEDIDVKRPPPGQGNAYAFIKFLNLDMAHRAKVEMSGQYIGKFQCKIGYGKPIPTTRIWVGGLGPWTSLSHLEREFDRFGAIKKIDFVRGDNHAYILYDSIDAAQAACKEMRGFPLGGQDKRLRVDFADTGPYNFHQSPARSASGDYFPPASSHQRHDDGPPPPPPPPPSSQVTGSDLRFCSSRDAEGAPQQWQPTSATPSSSAKGPGFASSQQQPQAYDGYYEANTPGGNSSVRPNPSEWPNNARDRNDPAATAGTNNDYNNSAARQWSLSASREHQSAAAWRGSSRGEWSERRGSGKRPRTPDGDQDDKADRERRSPKRSPTPTSRDRDRQWRGGPLDDKRAQSPSSRKHVKGEAEIGAAASLQELVKCCSTTWLGGLILKSSCFPTKMLPVGGNAALTDTLIATCIAAPPALKITQRLRLDQPKLDDVLKRLTASGPEGHCVFVAVPGTPDPGAASAANAQGPGVQQRPLRNLVSYLKQKEAAGVISLTRVQPPPAGEQQTGVLYAFPPCKFSNDLLRRSAPNLSDEGLKDDHHLVMVVVRGAV